MKRVYKGNSLFEFPSDYTVVDIETNGFDSGYCEIIEISAIKVRGERQAGVFSSLIKPCNKISRFITNLTGIDDKTVENAPDIENVLPQFYEFLGQDIIIGHNVNFDIDFLYDKLWLHSGLLLTNNFVDTLRLSRRALPDLENHKQVTVAKHFKIVTDGAHRALRDCEICNECYLNLKRILLG